MIKRGKFIAHWLLQPGMYHYRRRIAAAPTKKHSIEAMMRAADAYSGYDLRHRYRVEIVRLT